MATFPAAFDLNAIIDYKALDCLPTAIDYRTTPPPIFYLTGLLDPIVFLSTPELEASNPEGFFYTVIVFSLTGALFGFKDY